MIDIHSHILPGVDDGAKTLPEALDMLRIAVDQGVSTQVLTPHILFGRYDNTKQDLISRFKRFKEEVAAANIIVDLKLGAELRIDAEIMQLVKHDQVPWLGEYQGKKTFLLEFPRIDVPHGSENLVEWLLQKNILPIIVHPERNSTFINHPEKLQTLIDLGCPLQITASSLTGKFGDDVQQFSETLLIEGKVSAIASDCHNLKGRSPDLRDGFKQAVNIIGKEKATHLVSTRPAALTFNNHY